MNMSEKRKKGCNETGSASIKCRTHRVNSFERKMDIIRRSENGESQASIGRFYDLSRSTVSSILKEKEKIKQYVRSAGNVCSGTIISKRRGAVVEEMEKSLTVWIEDQHQKNIPLSLSVIQGKASSLFEDWKKKLGEDTTDVGLSNFKASRGWFDRYKSRAGLHNIKLTGESASADKEAADKFVRTFAEIVDAGNYSAHQIFNVDETGLFWKKMPERTYLAKEENVAPGHKAAKDRLTLLLGGNAAGDCKLKPMLVYHSENPRAFKGKDKGHLPVIWKANSKAWVTGALFQDWFTQHFVPAVKKYCCAKNMAFKALLILDNAPGHPHLLQDLCPEIQVIFLPPNTTSEIQPMDQTVIATFKRYYMRRTVSQAIKAIDKEGGPNLKEFWKNYNIWDAVHNISESWGEMKQSTMAGCWGKLCPDLVPNFKGFEKTPEAATEDVVQLMNQLDLEVTTEDVEELIASHSEPLSNEDLLALQEANSLVPSDYTDDGNKNLPTKSLTTKKLKEAFTHLENFFSVLEESDPEEERFAKVRKAVEKDTACYRLLQEEKRNCVQLSLQNFFRKADKTVVESGKVGLLQTFESVAGSSKQH